MHHHTEQEFLRIIEELKEQERQEDQRQDSEFKMIISALRLHAEGEQQLNKQINRLVRSTTLLSTMQIVLFIISIIVALYLGIRAT
jgi:hypothetical protein